jgi:CBS domain-containing protein
MLVSEAMRGPVDTCAAEATLAQAARMMVDEDIGALPVTLDGRLLGILTERDILRAVADRRLTEEVKVSVFMTPNPDSMEPDVKVEEAANWMLAAGYRHLPVVADGEILGIVSIKDVMWALTGGTEGKSRGSSNGIHV